MQPKTKQELLDDYAPRSPKLFAQFDDFHREGPDCVFHPDDDHDCLSRLETLERMVGSDVRVLIPAGTSRETAVRWLDKIRDWIERDRKDGVPFISDETRFRFKKQPDEGEMSKRTPRSVQPSCEFTVPY